MHFVSALDRVAGLRCVLGLAETVVAGCADQTGPESAAPSSQRPSLNFAQTGTKTGDWIVTVKTFGSMANVEAEVAAAGGTVIRSFPEIGVLMAAGVNAAGMTTVWNQGDLSGMIPDRTLQWIPTVVEDDALTADGPATSGTNQSTASFFSFYQWNMRQIQAPAAWVASPAGLGRTVCVLDTGIDPGHLDTNGKVDMTKVVSMSTNTSFAGNQTIFDYHFHGTFVASNITSRGIAMASVAPDAKLCSVKVLGSTGSGSFGDVIAGIMYAANIHADVINMSLGAYFDARNGGWSLVQALQAAVDYANKMGTVVVAAAGNNGINLDADQQDFVSVPAQIRGVLSVGATGPINQLNFDQRASYSNYGGVTGIQIVAPGGSGAPVQGRDLVIGACSRYALTFSCAAGNRYLLGNGTSFASPLVAGAAAVVRSNFAYALSPATVRRCLTTKADIVGPSSIYGSGRLNVAKALTCSP